MAKTNVEIQDYQGNVIHPKTSSEVVDYKESNVSVTLDELVARKKVFVQNEQPETDGVWFDTSDNQENPTGENPIVKNIRDYIDGNIKPPIDKNTQDIKTMSEKLDTGLNNLSQLSNPNLLINGDFQVWQRGTSFVNKNLIYTADRWKYVCWNATTSKEQGKLEKTDEGVKISDFADQSYILQPFEPIEYKKMNGKTITATVMIKGSNLTKGSFFIQFGYKTGGDRINQIKIIGYKDITNEYKVFTFTYTLPKGLTDFDISCGSFERENLGGIFNNDGILEIKYIKLEIGDKATPFIPRSYGEELALCQRYYIKNPSDSLFEFNRSQEGGLRCYIPTPSMRTYPTLVFPGDNVEMYGTTSVWENVPKEKCVLNGDYATNVCLQISIDDNNNLKEFRSYIARKIPSFDAEIY